MKRVDSLWRRSNSYIGRVSWLFATLVLILTTIGVRVWQTSQRYVDEDALVSHTLDVQQTSQTVLARLGAIQAAATVYAVSGAPLRKAEFELESPQLDRDLESLTDLVRDDPKQAALVAQLAAAVHQRQALLHQAIDSRGRSGALPPLPPEPMIGPRQIAAQIVAAQDKRLQPRRQEMTQTALTAPELTGVALGLSILFLTLMFVLILHAHRSNTRSARELQHANAQLADVVSDARRNNDSMQYLIQLGEMLQSCRSLEEVRNGLPEAFRLLLPDVAGRLAILNPSQELLAVGAHWGQHGVIAESVFPAEDCWALRRGQAYPLSGSSKGFVCRHVHWPNPDMPEAAYLCAPLMAQGEVIGLLTLDAPRPFTASERRLAIASAEQLALALANLLLQDTLRSQSIRDPLTGLFNRRYLEVSLERELARATRNAQPLAVLMLDLDHFKRFNDRYGHDAGDALLMRFARVLRDATRPDDVVCRYGGEEFTVILPATDVDAGRAYAERIRIAVSQIALVHHEQTLTDITSSIGLASFPLDARNGEELLRRADAALYRAKRDGRNRTTVASDPVAV